MYNPYLLISKQGGDDFSLIGMQTDDTLLLYTEKFSKNQQAALQETSFKAKPKTRLRMHAP